MVAMVIAKRDEVGISIVIEVTPDNTSEVQMRE